MNSRRSIFFSSPRAPRTYGLIFAMSFVAAVLLAVIGRALLPLGELTPWILLEALIESICALALFTLRPSYGIVLTVQVLLAFLLRTLNYLKNHYLGVPILPADFFLLKDLRDILPMIGFFFFLSLIFVPVGVSVWLILRNNKWPRRFEWAGALPFVAFLVWFLGFPRHSDATFDAILSRYGTHLPTMQTERSEAIGVSANFSLGVSKLLAKYFSKPDSAEVQSVIDRIPGLEKGRGPAAVPAARNIYVIVTETFWNPADALSVPGVSLLDPDFTKAWEDNGRRYMLVPTVGGGTANVEFEILCGIPSPAVGLGVVFEVAVKKPVGCLPNLLRRAGYTTLAFQAYDANFYSWNQIFPYLGFEKFTGMQDFRPDSKKGEFMNDDAFLSESIARARAMAAGKPFLAYMMTFAGHWPFEWHNDAAPQELRVDQRAHPDMDHPLVERHLNANRFSSQVLARTLREIRRDDPRALIVVAGDHQPGLARYLFPNLDGRTPDWRLFRTPLLIVDGEAPVPADLNAYQVSGEILARAGQPAGIEHIPLFRAPSGISVRPLDNGGLLVSAAGKNRSFRGCGPASPEPDCARAAVWFRDISVLGSDVIGGKQNYRESLGLVPVTSW